MNRKTMAVALLVLAGTSAALATPHETFDYVALNGGTPLLGTALLGGGGNSVVSATATGSYTVRSVRLVGNVAAWGANTYGTESRIQLTSSTGGVVVFGPFSPLASTPPGPVAFDISRNIPDTVAAGTWTVETYETYDDASDDATYDQVSVTLDDAALPVGQPGSFVDLGDFTLTNRNVTQTVTLDSPSDVKWFKMKLPSVANGDIGYVDIWATPVDPTQPVTDADLDDTDLALYNATTAQLVTYDDLDGPGYFGQLSYGSTTARPATVINGQGAGATFAGADGALTQDFYYLAVGQYTMAHPVDVTSSWSSVTSSYTGTRNTTVVHIKTQLNSAPYPPTITGTATPSTVEPTQQVVYAVTVVPGGNPASTGLAVVGNLTSVGGPASAAFHDDGLNGDAAAGDLVFSYRYTMPAGTAGGGYVIPVTVSDAQARTNTGSIASAVLNPTNLGTLTSDHTESGTVPAAFGAWFRFTTTQDASVAGNRYLDIDTNGSGIDTEIGLFRADGTRVADNDDGGVGLGSLLTFGSGGGTAQTDGGNGSTGANGDLPAGTYLLVVSQYNSTFADGPTVTYPPAGAGGAFNLNITMGAVTPPPPAWDEATNGGGDAGGDTATAFVPSGTGNLDAITGNIEAAGDADLYRINICDLANFSATTYLPTPGGTIGDTQLFLFNVDGTGVVMNDDVPTGNPGDATLLSRISGSLVPAAGEYYLAVVRWDNDPVDSGGLTIWADTPYDTERTPDGENTAGVLSSWTGGGEAGTYRISFTGACYSSGGGNVCGAADVGGTGGVPGADSHLDNNDFVVFVDYFFSHNALADQGMTGGVPGHDSIWDNNDFVVFIDNFFTAPATCR